MRCGTVVEEEQRGQWRIAKGVGGGSEGTPVWLVCLIRGDTTVSYILFCYKRGAAPGAVVREGERRMGGARNVGEGARVEPRMRYSRRRRRAKGGERPTHDKF